MADLAHSAHAQVIFLTTPGNEKDCSPFKSEPTPGLTGAQVAEAADGMRRAEALESLGSKAKAWDAGRKAAAIDAFSSQIRPIGPDEADAPVLPEAVLAYHRRRFEVLLA